MGAFYAQRIDRAAPVLDGNLVDGDPNATRSLAAVSCRS